MTTQAAPNPLLEKMQKALALQKNGELEKAQRIYKAVLRKAPNNADATHLLGVTYRQLGDPRRAFDLISRAIKLAPDRAAFYANLARTMSDMEGTTPDSVLAAANKALSLNPNLVEALNLKAISLSKLDRNTEAEEILQLLIVRHPNYCDAYRNYGVLLRDNKDHDKALAFFNKATLLEPDNPENYIERARCRLVMKNFDDSSAELWQALERFPDNGDLLHEAARLMFSISRTHEGLEYARSAVADCPTNYHRLVTLGVNLLMLNRATEALDCFKTARKLAPEGANGMNWNMSLAYLALGDLKNGWKYHSARFDDKMSQVTRRTFPVDAWNGEDISNKTVLLWGDQGLGDALKSGTMIPQLIDRAGKVILETSEKSVALFQRSFPDIQCRKAEMTADFKPKNSDFDLHTNITDLAFFFRQNLKSFKTAPCPVFKFDIKRARSYLARMDGANKKPIIGVSWRSRNLSANRARYYLSAPQIAPLLELDDVILVNLQYAAVSKEVQFLKSQTDDAFIDFEDIDLFNDLEGAAALTACCDFVVSANTSVADMAGVLDVPCARFGPVEAPLQLGQGEIIPWYPSMTYVQIEEDKPSSDMVPRIRTLVDKWISNFSPDRRNQRLEL